MTDPFQTSNALMDLLTAFDKSVPPCPTCGAKLYWSAPAEPASVRIWCDRCGYSVTGKSDRERP
jgi:hypothetical protein